MISEPALVDFCRYLPLFPLENALPLPGVAFPLQIYEKEGLDLVRFCLRENSPFALPQLAPGPFGILPYACLGVIVAHQDANDGHFNVVVDPRRRVRIMEVISGGPFLRAQAILLSDTEIDNREESMSLQGKRVMSLLRPLIQRHHPLFPILRKIKEQNLSECLAGFVLTTPEERQRFLAEDNPLLRARQVEDAIYILQAGLLMPKEIGEA